MERARLVFYIFIIPSWCVTTFNVLFLGVLTGRNPLDSVDQFIPSYIRDAVNGILVIVAWEVITKVRAKPKSNLGEKTPEESKTSD